MTAPYDGRPIYLRIDCGEIAVWQSQEGIGAWRPCSGEMALAAIFPPQPEAEDDALA